MTGKPFFLLLLVGCGLAGAYSGYACSCSSSFIFLRNLSRSSTIVQAEVLRHDSLPVATIAAGMKLAYLKEHPGNWNNSSLIPGFSTLTWLRVWHWIRPTVGPDTIVFFNYDNGMCGASMNNSPVGQRFLLNIFPAGNAASWFDQVDQTYYEAGPLTPLFRLLAEFSAYQSDLCLQYDLSVVENKVKGAISRRPGSRFRFRQGITPERQRKRMNKKQRQYARLRSKHPQRLERQQLRHAKWHQVWSYSRTVKLIQRRLDRLEAAPQRG